MAGPNGDITTLLGDVGEFGGGARVILPKSYYIMGLTVGDVDASNLRTNDEDEPIMIEDFEDANGDEVQAGGTPFVTIESVVNEGPFAGEGFNARFYLTPGKGKYIGLIQHAVRAITGKRANVKVLSEYNFEFKGDETPEEAQQQFRKYYSALTVDDRLDFMVKYCRVGEWDTDAIASVDAEEGQERENETTGEIEIPLFNRYKGFYSLSDGKKGQGYVRKVCHRKQERVAIEMGLIEGDAPRVGFTPRPVSATANV